MRHKLWNINYWIFRKLLTKGGGLIVFLFFNLSVFSQDSLYFRAKAFLSYEKYDSAYYFINAALKKDTNNIHYWQLKGDILFAQKHWNESINSYLRVKENKPNLVNYQLAKSYSQINDFEKAKKFLEAYLNQHNRIESYKVELDTCFRKFSKTKLWKDLWMRDFDNSYQDFLKQIEYNIRYEHYEDALEQIDNYLVSHPKKFYLYYLKGNILMIMNDKSSALTAYEKAYRMKSKNREVANAYGQLLFTLKKYKKAKAVFTQLNNTDKYDILPIKDIGKCDFGLKKYNKALQELGSFVKIYFKDPEANFYMAKSYLAKNEYFNALEAINISIGEKPHNFDYLFTRGKIYLESQAYKLAKKDFLLALDISNSNAGELYFLIGICYQHMGDLGMACSYWKRAYEHQYMEADDYRMKFCQ